MFRREHIGAILVEPVQGRGGIQIPARFGESGRIEHHHGKLAARGSVAREQIEDIGLTEIEIADAVRAGVGGAAVERGGGNLEGLARRRRQALPGA